MCQGCSAGKFKVLIGDISCVNCGAGKFSNLIAQKSETACQPCGQYSSSFQGATECTCDPGAETLLGGVICTLCAHDSYKSFTGNTACTPCQANSVAEFKGATESAACKCQSDLGWSLKPGGGPAVCEQVVLELGGKFQVPVVLSDFASDVNNVRTQLTVSIASAFDVHPANITLVYYAAEGTGNTPGQSRRLLQNSASATVVESQIKVFESKPRRTGAEVTASMALSMPGALILELQMSAIQVTPMPTPDRPSNFIWYVVGAGALFLFIFIVCMAVLIQKRCASEADALRNNNQDHSQHVVYYPRAIDYHNQGYVQNNMPAFQSMNHTTQSYHPPLYTTQYTR